MYNFKRRSPLPGLRGPYGRQQVVRVGNQYLTPKESLFVREFPKDWNGTSAALRAGIAKTRSTGAFIGSDMLSRPRVLLAINEVLRERQARIDVTIDQVARYWLDIATADLTELSPAKVGSCRYCWGHDHQYQYTKDELRQLVQEHRLKHQRKMSRRDQPHHREDTTTIQDEPPLFDDRGGDGFDPTRTPNELCPECHGLGKWYLKPIDFDKLSPGARSAFEGIKYNRDGSIEVKTRNLDTAMQKFSEIMGFIKPRRSLPDFDFDSLNPEQLDAVLSEAKARGLLREDELPKIVDATPVNQEVARARMPQDDEERVS